MEQLMRTYFEGSEYGNLIYLKFLKKKECIISASVAFSYFLSKIINNTKRLYVVAA